MSTIKPMPSLSEKGWISDARSILAKILSFYILTDARQTLLFSNNLINLPETYHKHINDPLGMADAVRSELTTMLNRYFEESTVVTEVKKEDKYHAILLYAEVVTEDGKTVSLGKVVKMDNDGLRKTIDVNNYGDGAALLN